MRVPRRLSFSLPCLSFQGFGCFEMRIIVIAYFVFRLVAAVAVSLLQVERDDDVGIQEPNATIR